MKTTLNDMFQKGNKHGKRFSSDNQPPNRGRKPSLYKQLEGIIGREISVEFSKEDYTKIAQWLLERTKSQLEEIATDSSIPVFVISMVSALVMDIRRGNTYTVDRIIDRAFGKATQPMDVTLKEQITFIIEQDDDKAEQML